MEYLLYILYILFGIVLSLFIIYYIAYTIFTKIEHFSPEEARENAKKFAENFGNGLKNILEYVFKDVVGDFFKNLGVFVWNKMKEGAETVARETERVANIVGNEIKKGAETTAREFVNFGNTIKGGFDRAGQDIKNLWCSIPNAPGCPTNPQDGKQRTWDYINEADGDKAYCLDAGRDPVYFMECANARDNQNFWRLWSLDKQGRLRNKQTNKCLTASGSVRVEDCRNGDASQQWSMINGLLVNSTLGQCLDGGKGSAPYMNRCMAGNWWQEWGNREDFRFMGY